MNVQCPPRWPCEKRAWSEGGWGAGAEHSRLYRVTTCRQLSSCRLYSWILFTCTSNMDEGLTFTPYSFSRKAENFALFSWENRGKDGGMFTGPSPQGWCQRRSREGMPRTRCHPREDAEGHRRSPEPGGQKGDT